MFFKKWKVLIVFAVIVPIITFLSSYFLLPQEIRVTEGREYQFDFYNPLYATVSADETIVTNGAFQWGIPLTLHAEQPGDYHLSLDLMGFIPVRDTLLKVRKEQFVYPSGQSAGVKILTDGVLVLSLGTVEDPQNHQLCPAREAGIEPGDYIFKVGGQKLKNSNHLSQLVDECGEEPIEVELKRGEKSIKTLITPVVSQKTGTPALGMWVRDSTAGLGTITFYTADQQKFAALGHCISDVDVGKTMTVRDGELVTAKVIGRIKGKRGEPGELRGIFDEPQQEIGHITKNNDFGLYGTVTNLDVIPGEPIPVALKNEIKTGPATIRTTISGYDVSEYHIEITKIFHQQKDQVKNMVIQVTDPRLLEQTGGIVQGMSGSPILQNGRIVGAVTHVFVNDPTRGYGIFIENMLAEAEKSQ